MTRVIGTTRLSPSLVLFLYAKCPLQIRLYRWGQVDLFGQDLAARST